MRLPMTVKSINLITDKEQQRRYLLQMRRGYELMEAERLRDSPGEPTDDEKEAFDRLMEDAWHHRKPSTTCGLAEWYRKLLRPRP